MNENENKYTELVEFTNILFHKFHEIQGAKLRDTFGRILQELREDTNADPLAKFVVYNRLYELAIDKTNFELVKFNGRISIASNGASNGASKSPTSQ